MPGWLRWLLISGTYIHTGFKHCAERDGHYFLVSLISSASTPSPHPAIHFSPSASFIRLPLSHHLQEPSSAFTLPFTTFPFPSLCRSALFPIYHSTLPRFSPSPDLSSLLPPHPPQLPSPLFLIISTLRLPLAAFSLSASALLSLSFGPGSLPIPRSSAHLSLFRLRPAWTDTLPGKQSKAKWTKGRRRVKESMKAEKWQRKSRDRDKKTCKIRRKKNWILEVLIFNHSYDLYGFIFIFKRCV